jgi:hypothetical protein
LSPTYELAIQTGEVAAKMAQFCPEIKIRLAVRGEESKLIGVTIMTVFHVISLSSFLRHLPVLCLNPEWSGILVVVGFEVLTVLSMKMAVFWVQALCGLE